MTQRALFLQHIGQTSPSPMLLEIQSAKGSILVDREGKKYIDLISGIAVSNIGHGNVQVKKAIRNQLENHTHLMVYGEYIQSAQVQFAKKLTELLDPTLNSVYFVNSGSEAIEGALKLAKKHTGRAEIISAKNAYHGSTHGALSLMSDEYFKNSFRPLLPGVHHIEFNNVESLERINERVACVIIEPIQAEAGIILPSKAFLQALRDKCTQTGTLLLFDEIQTGFGRSGALFAHQLLGVLPDILVLGKALGGGLPLGAFIADKKIMDAFMQNPVLGHITTFGGHPLSCASGLASLEFILDKKLCEKSVQKQARFLNKLKKIEKKVNIRNFGMLFAIECKSPKEMMQIVQYCIEKGVIVDWFLFNNHSVRLCPPLIITNQEIDLACEIICQAVAQIE